MHMSVYTCINTYKKRTKKECLLLNSLKDKNRKLQTKNITLTYIQPVEEISTNLDIFLEMTDTRLVF